MSELEKKLRSMSVKDLKKEISKTNVKGYSSLKKEEVIQIMLKYPKRFSYLINQEQKKAKLEKINILKQKPQQKPELKKPELKEPNINEVFNLDNKKFSIIEKIEKNLKPLDFKKLKEKDIKQLLQAEKNKPSGLFNSKGDFNINEKNKNFINKNRIKIIQFIEGTGGKSKGSALSGGAVGVKRGVNIDYLDNNGNYKSFTVLRHRGDTIYIYDGDKIIDSSFNGVSSFVNKERHIEEYEKLKKQILIDGKNKKWKDKYLKYVDERIEEIKNTPEEKKPKAPKNISPEELRTVFI